MTISRRALLATAGAAALPLVPARAQSAKIRIGVLTDLSGPYRDATGPTSIICVRLAAQEFAAQGHGRRGDRRRPPEQGRHRRGDRAALDRQ